MSAKAYLIVSNFSLFSFHTKFNPPIHSLSHSHSPSFPYRCSCELGIPTRKGIMGERVMKIAALGTEDDEESVVRVLEQEALVGGSTSSSSPSSMLSPEFETIINRLSKWVVAGIFGGVILWRHDAEALWVAMGSVLNSLLSLILKRILNQDRPVGNRKSDPGMPSSHAQSIMFATVFLILSMVEWLGLNEFTLIFAVVSLAVGSYLSWLRVAQKFHTVSQVAVGAALGFCFSLLWVWSWDSAVSDVFNSLLWVRVSILLGSAICCLGFLAYVVLNWFTEEQ